MGAAADVGVACAAESGESVVGGVSLALVAEVGWAEPGVGVAGEPGVGGVAPAGVAGVAVVAESGLGLAASPGVGGVAPALVAEVAG